LAYRLNEKTVTRAGYGISYMPFPDNTYAYNFPVRQNNAFNSPNNNPYAAAGSMAQGFPAPLVATIPPDGIIRNAALNQNYDVIPLDFREGYVMSYNVAVQRTLPGLFVLEAAYVGNRGIRNPTVYNLNAGQIIGAAAAGQPLFARFGRTADTNIRFVGTNTYYNSLQVKFDRRYANGFQLTTAYTFSKSIDYTSGNGGLRYYIDQARNKARSDFDRNHVFTQSYIYELPFGKGRRFLNEGIGAWILGGWQTNAIMSIMSGLPLNFNYTAAGLRAPGNSNSPDIVGDFKVLGKIGTSGTWFDTSVFAAPPNNRFGNLGRNVLSGPGFFNLDFSVFRRFPVTERVGAEFRFESFNFTNTPQYGNPNTDLNSANFGRINGLLGDSQAQPRQIQLGMRVTF
jgi:hypothetical protein